MRLLLDTHILLWLMQDAPQLGQDARRLLAAADEICVSSVSLWEVAIKRGLGKLTIDLDALDASLELAGIVPLNVTWAHVRQVRRLPPLHADPFDRMLVAQAILEPMHLLTHDATLPAYSDLVVLV